MNQETSNIFWVDPGEVVEIIIEAQGVAETVVASKDGTPFDPLATKPLRYRFTVTADRGESHFLTFEYVFPGGPTDDAAFVGTAKQFVTKVKSGAAEFQGPTVTPDTKTKAQELTFNVRVPGTDFDFPTT